MRILLLLMMLVASQARCAMDITRELVAPENVVPGQPMRIAITYWTDSWFNPPPAWPDMLVKNGTLLTTALPNQLLTRRHEGANQSGIRFEKQIIAWDEGALRLPALDVTLVSAGLAPRMVHLPALEKPVAWPKDIQQPDRFLPASTLSLTQKITVYRAVKGDVIHAGDVIERQVTVKAGDIVPGQIPQLLYAIPGLETQRLAPVNQLIKTGRGEVEGAIREETLRYLPSQAGTLNIPALKLRWWDTSTQAWQLAQLPGSQWKIAQAPDAGSEAVLRAVSSTSAWHYALLICGLIAVILLGLRFRYALRRGGLFLHNTWRRFWRPVALANLAPTRGEKK